MSASSTVDPRTAIETVASAARRAITLELETFPKPGLVSPVDPGSHRDMDAFTFRRSAEAIAPFWRRLAKAGAERAALVELRTIGLAAEAAMMAATGGVNTHRGAIFGLGLLCAAAGTRASGALGSVVAGRWGREIMEGAGIVGSHGAEARRRHGAGGARAEAAGGFPSVYRTGLPALRDARRLRPDDEEAARVHVFLALVASVEDTNLLHRGGRAGLDHAAREANRFLERGGIARPSWRDDALALHRDLVRRSLSPGGSADLLAMTLFVDQVEHARGTGRRG